MEKENKNILYSVLGISFLILAVFLFRILTHGLSITGADIKYDITGQVGDFIGGVIGTIFSGAGFYFLYVTLVEQRKAGENQKEAFEKERFETRFFELIRLHKENVNEMKYNKIKKPDAIAIEGRKVFNTIHIEFRDCLSEVKRFCKIYDNKNYVRDNYKPFLNNIIIKNKLKVNTDDLAIIDIAYLIVYYGVGKEGEILLRNSFLMKYNDDFYYQLLKFIQLKPNLGYKEHYKAWKTFKNLGIDKLKNEFKIVGKNKNNKSFEYIIDGTDLMQNYRKIKFYGGHQHRLGHYFRHLFQSYKYLIIQNNLSDEEKYFYGKTFRAQLSNYEQSLIFINSITSLGYNWELNSEKDNKENELKMITTFQLIKNVTGRRVLDVSYKDFYKKIKFEFESINNE